MHQNQLKCVLGIFVVLFCLSSVQARSSKNDVPFNLDWKFITGNPANAQSPTFNDAAWATVSVPHSASYDLPTPTAEHAFYKGDYWYRKSFTCPANARKVFINFGAIMQTVTVYVNGTLVGTHDNSGYTGFFFDISPYVVRGASTCVALHCNVIFDTNIPPGGDGGNDPDFELFSGMYRDVQLQFKDSVYVPLRGQEITTPGSTTSAGVRAVTSIRNDASASKNVTVALTLRTATGTSVATQTLTQTVNANSNSSFDITTPNITPSLWSPTTPTLYSLQTMVSVAGVVVDSVVESVGFRFYTWNTGKFSINGNITELKGMCLAQFMGWIENAIPDSRYSQQVAMIKAMGINSIRCSHYPRADAFYRACDSIGMLVYVEVPTWGVDGGFSGRTAFWNRIYSCDSEMVLDGYNHPSIYAWGLFNEQNENLDTYFANEMNVIHGIDPVAGSGRVCAVANLNGSSYTADILAINYATGFTGLSTEAYGNATNDANEYGNWYRNYIRGGTMDTSSTTGESAQEVNCMQNHYWLTNDNMAGGHFWCFMDYSSGRNTTGREGIVDRLWLPKQVYFRFKNILTGGATDYWAAGTPTQLVLTADVTTLRADGSDVSQIVATLRNASGACVHTDCNITFTASPAGCVTALYTGHSTSPTSGNPVTVAVEGGRAGILLRTSRTAGTITLTATNSCGLASTSVTLNSNAVNEAIPALTWPGTSIHPESYHMSSSESGLKMVNTEKGIMLSFPTGIEGKVQIVNTQGKNIATYTLSKGVPLLIGRSVVGNGMCFAVWNNNGFRMQTRLNMVR